MHAVARGHVHELVQHTGIVEDLATRGVGLGREVADVDQLVVVEKLDNSFHAPDDVMSFIKVPILATIPRVFTAAATRRLRFRRIAATSAAIIVLTLLAAGSWYVAAGNEMITRLTTRGA